MEFPIGSSTINDYIKEYLSYNSFQNTYDCFTAELQAKTVTKQLISPKNPEEKKNPPKIMGFLLSDKARTDRENSLENSLFAILNAYKKVLNSSRLILSNSMNLVEFLHENKEVFFRKKPFFLKDQWLFSE